MVKSMLGQIKTEFQEKYDTQMGKMNKQIETLTEEITRLSEENISIRKENISIREENTTKSREIDNLNTRVEALENQNKFLLDLNSNLIKRINLEFFLRAYFDVPSHIKISNQGEMLKAMFEDIILNCEENKNKR